MYQVSGHRSTGGLGPFISVDASAPIEYKTSVKIHLCTKYFV